VRKPTIPVFEVRSIGIEEHLYILSELSIDSLGFVRSWLIRSIFGVMVLGSIVFLGLWGRFGRADASLKRLSIA
jgi:hypothetical protein